MYNIKHIFTKEPNAVREAVIAVLAVLVMTDVVEISADAVAGIGVSLSLLLGLFYVRPLSSSNVALNEWKEVIDAEARDDRPLKAKRT